MTGQIAVEAVRAAGINFAPAAGAAAADPGAAADPAAIARFAAALAPQGPERIPFAAEVAEAFRAAQDARQTVLHRVNALTELAAERALSVAELSALQYDVASLSFHQEVVANVAKKASDAVSTLVRNG